MHLEKTASKHRLELAQQGRGLRHPRVRRTARTKGLPQRSSRGSPRTGISPGQQRDLFRCRWREQLFRTLDPSCLLLWIVEIEGIKSDGTVLKSSRIWIVNWISLFGAILPSGSVLYLILDRLYCRSFPIRRHARHHVRIKRNQDALSATGTDDLKTPPLISDNVFVEPKLLHGSFSVSDCERKTMFAFKTGLGKLVDAHYRIEHVTRCRA